MPNINDFKLVAKKSERYADILLRKDQNEQKIEGQKKKERMGFYLFILENICGVHDFSDLQDIITDTEFNHLVLGCKKIDDCGIDAIYIDEEDYSINLFNFKYREKFVPNTNQKLNEAFVSAKFVNAVVTENTKSWRC